MKMTRLSSVYLCVFFYFICNAAYAREDLYFVARGVESGNPMTYRGFAERLPTSSAYPHLISIFWNYEPIASGLAPETVNIDQNAFEDLTDSLDVEGNSRLALVVFGNGRKEWHWYVKDIDGWLFQFNEIMKNNQSYPLVIEHTSNDHWAFYDAFYAWVKKNSTVVTTQATREKVNKKDQ